MAGPSVDFLTALNNGLDLRRYAPAPAAPVMMDGSNSVSAPAPVPGPSLLPPAPPGPPPDAAPPPSPVDSALGMLDLRRYAPAGPPPPPPPPAGSPGVAPPSKEMFGPPNPNAQPASMPQEQQPQQDISPDVQFSPVTSGGSPAREVSTRGPKQEALLDRSFEHPLIANEQIRDRNTEMAGREAEMYEQQAAQALERQAAFERQAQRRAQEMQMLQADYQQTIGELSRFKLDNNRVWNNTSTLDKIGATLLAIIGGVAAGPGGNNIVLQSINGTIQEDVDNQKRAYEQGLELAKGQQSAFGMAMHRYQSEDAAYHAALAAGQEAVAAKINGMKAHWKGAQSQNEADAVAGDLLFKADQNKAAGMKYLQPTMGSTKYKMTVRGQEIPGLVSEDKAQGYTIEHAVKPGEEADKALLGGAIQGRLQSQKAQLDAQKAGKDHIVVLPNGDEIAAPTDKDAEKLRTLSMAVDNAQQLVAEAKRIRKSAGWHLDPGSIRRLEGIQSELTLAFKDRGGLGALSGPDMDLAVGATGKVANHVAPGIEAQLDQFTGRTNAALRNYVKTIKNAPPKSAGVMPGSFQPKAGQ